jgi:arsenite methyltransferase
MSNLISKNHPGIWSGVLAGLSILTCYGTLALVAVLALIGIQLNIHEGIWATAIVILTWATVGAIALEFRRLRFIPSLVSVILGALLITTVMFISYNRIVEISGFAFILIAVIWNRQIAAKLSREKPEGD